MITDKDLEKLRVTSRKAHMRYKHAAGVFDTKGNLICVGHNQRTNRGSIHAEVAAIKKYLHSHRPRGRKIGYVYVVRFNPRGQPKNSKPCRNCQILLDKLEVPVYWSK